MTLSEIMRFSLQMDKNNQLMLLTDEIDHIKNIISINKLRFDNKLYIDLIVDGDIQNIYIIPLTLVTLLENILKHGDCTNEETGALINLKVDKDKTLLIETFNKKKDNQIKPLNGISLDNLQKRLNSYYGKNFNLTINNQDDFYMLSLKIVNHLNYLKND